MAHVVFAWELGGGLGHLVRYRLLIDRLCKDGHRVSFVARDVERARRVFAGRPVEFAVASYADTPVDMRILPPQSFADVLWNSGYADADALTARLAHWCEQLRPLAADVLVGDYAPSAMLAARVLGWRAIASGNGFYLPPAVSPLPPLRYWLPVDRPALAASEARLLQNLNSALTACGGPPAASVVEAILGQDSFVQSFAEFDHAYERPGAAYLGAYPSAEFGVPPVWPAGCGPRLFGYLDPAVLLPAVLDAAAAIGARFCLYAPGVEAGTMAAHPTVAWMGEPVDLQRAAVEADAYVSNANINSMMAFLLAGKPLLVLPYTLEKYLVGRRLEMLGAGLSAPRREPGDLTAKLKAVLTQRSYRRSAEQFARRHAGRSEAEAAQRMFERLGIGREN